MRVFFVVVAVASLSTLDARARGRRRRRKSKTPLMVSFADLKWVEFPERKGMQFAVLTGDPKIGPYTQIRKVSAGN